MLKAEPPSIGWKYTDLNHLTKTFNFKSPEKLTEFMLGILTVEHEPGDPLLEGIESINELSMKVSVETICAEKNVHKMINIVENIFVGCVYGKNRTFWAR
jgi:hypothetical protein